MGDVHEPYGGQKETRGEKAWRAILHYGCPAQAVLSTSYFSHSIKKEQRWEELGEGCISQQKEKRKKKVTRIRSWQKSPLQCDRRGFSVSKVSKIVTMYHQPQPAFLGPSEPCELLSAVEPWKEQHTLHRRTISFLLFLQIYPSSITK